MNRWCRSLIGLAAGSVAALMPHAAMARVVSNIAQASWDSMTGTRTVQSNRVDIAVSPVAPPSVANIFSIHAPGNGQPSLINGTGCTGSGQGNAGVLDPPPIATGIPISITPSREFTAGQPVAFAIESIGDNLDPNVRETVAVIVRAGNGDEEQLLLREDAPNSGFFIGYLPTVRIPPPVTTGDCRLSVAPGAPLPLELYRNGANTLLASAIVSFLVDPFGIVFDSGDGTPVSGARVTIIDDATGQPAQVFGDDGVSAYPNSMITGSTVTDSSGQVYAFPPGDYRFPFVAPGRYRLIVSPPDPYVWPSAATIGELATFRRPDNGEPYTLGTFSYGAPFDLVTPAPVRVDIPIDRPGNALILSKTANTVEAFAGQTVQYRISVSNRDNRRNTGPVTVTDILPRTIRLRPNSIRYDGALIAADIAPDGRRFSVILPGLGPSSSGTLTYLVDIRPDARPGDAINIATASDNRGSTSNTADATIRIRRDLLGDRLTVTGRVTSGGCAANPAAATGIGGVRVMMQDGRFAVTDSDGRYHFEGVRPGLHVVQIDPSSLPAGQAAVDCGRNTRSAGSAISRFVEGRGGELRRVDFRAAPITSSEVPMDAGPVTIARVAAPPRPTVLENIAAAGSGIDLFSGQTAGIDWLFPAPGHNPRSPAIRIAIKHLPGQTISLSLNGTPVDPHGFDGVVTSPDGSFRISSWQGVEIRPGINRFTARVTNADGSLAAELSRSVTLSGGALNATLVPELSLLVADGLNRPVIAVRLTDRNGNPVRHGVVGDFNVAPPHRAAQDADAMQERQLSGNDRQSTNWRIEGDDGLAFIELEPTTSSGAARIDFSFREGEVVRQQQVDVWLNPGDRPWTIVGFAAGTIGYNTLKDRMEPVADELPLDNVDGRIALYAQGRISGQWLMTLAYDSDKEADDARFGGVIDPRAYYTVYADRSDQGFDAASVRNLYLRLERPQFYALFGDFETGFNDTQLTRYQRSLNGGRGEYRGQQWSASAFVADTPFRHRRDEIQGNGLSGPYQLGARLILANSERITIETRDRLRSDLIVSSITLSRYIDYDIDYFAGTIRLREPLLSRDSALNPQFLVADYEVDGVGRRALNAGGRVSWTSPDGTVRIGGTLIHDEDDNGNTELGGVDLRFRPDAGTEIRAEFAKSFSDTATGERDAHGWLIEAEHHGSIWDILAYARERQAGFGVGQLSLAGESSRRIGLDGRVRLSSNLSLLASGWQEDYQQTGARRRAARIQGEWRDDNSALRAGLIHADDDLANGDRNRSDIVQIGGSQRLFGQRLEVSAQTEFALSGHDDSVDFPARHTLGARLSLMQNVALTAAYEIADGGTVEARTLRAGFDIQPWQGARGTLSGGQQSLGELGSRSFAAYGLRQSLQLSERLAIDASIDGQRTLSGIDPADVLDPRHPVASGGFLASNGAITEDFTALTAGATYRTDNWSLALRGEYRDGEATNQYGVTAGGIRRIGDGDAFGGLVTWTRADSRIGASTDVVRAEVSWAHRPDDSRIHWLEKLEFRFDDVRNAVLGQAGPTGGPALTVSGDVRSRRVVNSLSVNYTPIGYVDGLWRETGEYVLFWGVRHASERFGPDDVSGWSTIVGADARIDLRDMLSIGVAANARVSTNGRATAWGGGPQLVVTPIANANFIIGYNINGFSDRDFEDNRFTRGGLYATFRLKFDQTSVHSLGLSR